MTKKLILILTILFSTCTSAGLLDAEVEIDLSDKTRLWAENLLNKVEVIVGRKLADIDQLIYEHEDSIFEKISQLSQGINGHAICLEEKANQDLNAFFSRLSDNRGFLGRLIGPKDRYTSCGNYMDIKVAMNATVREAAVCVYEKAISDTKRDYSSSTTYALSEDISNAFFTTWCSNIAKPGFAGATDTFMREHSHYAELAVAWLKLKQLNDPKCLGTNTIDGCLTVFVDHAIHEVNNSHPDDVKNGLNILETIKSELASMRVNKSRKEKNEILGDIQYVLNFVERARIDRLKLMKPILKKLFTEVNKLSPQVSTLVSRYSEANTYCDQNNWVKVNQIMKLGIQTRVVLERNSTLALIDKYRQEFEEISPKLDGTHAASKNKIENLLAEYSNASKFWKLNNVSTGTGRCFTDFFCGQKTQSCNEAGVSY